MVRLKADTTSLGDRCWKYDETGSKSRRGARGAAGHLRHRRVGAGARNAQAADRPDGDGSQGRPPERQQRRGRSRAPHLGPRLSARAGLAQRAHDDRRPDSGKHRDDSIACRGRPRRRRGLRDHRASLVAGEGQRPVPLHRHRRRAERDLRRDRSWRHRGQGWIGIRDREVDPGRGHRGGCEGPHQRQLGQRRYPDHRGDRRRHRGVDQWRHRPGEDRSQEPGSDHRQR